MLKYKNSIYLLLLLLTSCLALWIFPALLKKSTYTPQKFPFVYYSSVLKELCLIDYKNKETPLKTVSGKIYPSEKVDSLLPMLNYRQLLADGKLPDTVDGREINPKILRMKNLVFRYSPNQINAYDQGLYIMYESMPKRLGLELPGDVFRMKNKIEFLDVETNSKDEEKSLRFQKAIEKRNYLFPSQFVAGNLNPRKPYDEGYFCLDAKGDLFHLKMVNGEPFFRNTNLGQKIEIAFFSMYEVADKRFYGFLFGKTGEVYIVEGVDGKYNALKLEIDPLDLQNDRLMIMGNLLYWMVSVETAEGKNYFALRTDDLKQVENFRIQRSDEKWKRISGYLFPFYLSLEDRNSDFIYPRIIFTGFVGFFFHFLLALLFVALFESSRKRTVFCFVYILVMGGAGLFSLLIFHDFRKNKFKLNKKNKK